MSVSDEYLEYMKELLAWVPGLLSKRMFGGAGLSSDGLTFAVVVDDTLYLKADDANRALYRDGGGEIFSYLRKGKPQTMGYWSVPGEVLEEPEALESWVRAALEAALRARKSG